MNIQCLEGCVCSQVHLCVYLAQWSSTTKVRAAERFRFNEDNTQESTTARTQANPSNLEESRPFRNHVVREAGTAVARGRIDVGREKSGGILRRLAIDRRSEEDRCWMKHSWCQQAPQTPPTTMPKVTCSKPVTKCLTHYHPSRCLLPPR